MKLSSLNFFQSLQKDNKQFAVIGLGRFGRAVSMTLKKLGYEVLGTDIDDKKVSQALSDQLVSHALQVDSTDPLALQEAGVLEMDTVIVAIGNYIQESVITTLNLKEARVAHVVAKASSEVHMKLLKKVGADHVVFPEHDAGQQLARSLTNTEILARFELDPESSIVELFVPKEFSDRTISELDLRRRYGISLLAISQGDKFITNPDPSKVLKKGMAMVVLGSNEDINKLPSD
jgi:trk system potassium uptake protein TrkA